MKLISRSSQLLKVLYNRSHTYVTCKNISRLPDPSQRIVVSTSTNIYNNLALEDWLYENTDLSSNSILLLWRDSPCVVIGRHQNPWVECNVPFCERNGIQVARRKSGGGTVYHDEGNVNVSFLVDRSRYNRMQNLEFVVNALQSRWDLPLSINERDDIILYDKYKISGTAAKLARNKSYHHFTLLLNVDKIRLKSILYSNLQGCTSKATESVRMSVANLADHIPEMDYDTLVHTIIEKYTHSKQECTVQYVDAGLSMETQFPGITKHIEELSSPQWIFQKTPPFSIDRRFHETLENTPTAVEVALTVQKGFLHNTRINTLNCSGINSTAIMDLTKGLENVEYEHGAISRGLSDIKTTWISREVYDVNSHMFLDWLLWCVMETSGLFPERAR